VYLSGCLLWRSKLHICLYAKLQQLPVTVFRSALNAILRLQGDNQRPYVFGRISLFVYQQDVAKQLQLSS